MGNAKLRNPGFSNLRSSFLNCCQPGFALLEVMIALAVVGGLLITLIYTLNYNLTILEKHEGITVASLLAREKIAEAEKSLENRRGAFPEPYSEYFYETVVRDSVFPKMSEISVVVKRDKEEARFTKLVQSSKWGMQN